MWSSKSIWIRAYSYSTSCCKRTLKPRWFSSGVACGDDDDELLRLDHRRRSLAAVGRRRLTSRNAVKFTPLYLKLSKSSTNSASSQQTTRSSAVSATRCATWNLVSCYTTVWTTCTTNPQQIEVIILALTRPRTCNKLCASSHDASTVESVVNKLDRRWVLLTTRSTCRGEIFHS